MSESSTPERALPAIGFVQAPFWGGPVDPAQPPVQAPVQVPVQRSAGGAEGYADGPRDAEPQAAVWPEGGREDDSADSAVRNVSS